MYHLLITGLWLRGWASDKDAWAWVVYCLTAARSQVNGLTSLCLDLLICENEIDDGSTHLTGLGVVKINQDNIWDAFGTCLAHSRPM